jgi:hypothetical protein
MITQKSTVFDTIEIIITSSSTRKAAFLLQILRKKKNEIDISEKR